eukprot:TRINITY_DN36688_c0_g1_i1.p1 TRINITY_DN36688_c0_g1~~TRINITY_DN36688_c0_g1_i1.p1  ORF type:complete len:593 (-),score=124.57 TRINITY_DN36688_c0_g1_i1:97-1875(-)
MLDSTIPRFDIFLYSRIETTFQIDLIADLPWTVAFQSCGEAPSDTGDAARALQHLHAAEQHLAALEQWMGGTSIAQEEDTISQSERLRKDLGLATSLDTGPQDEFEKTFKSALPGEICVRSLAASVKSHSFRHPGKVYITNCRLCFYSCIVGVEGVLSTRWQEISSLRLKPNAETSTYPIVIALKKSIEFDGASVDQLEMRMFDFSELGLLHKCVTYFLGTDLFGTWSEEDPAPRATPAASTRALRTASMLEPEEVLNASCMWELERRSGPFRHKWRAPCLPHEGVTKMKWVAFENGAYKHHDFIPRDANVETIAASETPPVESVEFLGQRRNCSWSTHPVDGETDELGWQYSTDFVIGSDDWTPQCGTFSFVRRRCWQPSFYVDADGAATQERSAARRATTVLQGKAPGTKDPIYNLLFEDVPGEALQKLAQDLEKDDWQDPSSLMAFYWKEMGIKELDIGAWTDGSEFPAPVKGKVRSIEMRVPVPPKPMCPRETRAQSTWHLVVEEDMIVLESITMSLDVPCGTNFNVIVCDTFTVEDGKLKIQRTCGLEWLQSSWLKSMVEQNVPPQLVEVAETLVKEVREWWKQSDA